MEERTPVAKIKKMKPPVEPPPLLEIHPEEQQCIDDTVANAKTLLHQDTIGKISSLKGTKYSPTLSEQTKNPEMHKYLLKAQISANNVKKGEGRYQTRYPCHQYLKIPTPKTRDPQQYHRFHNLYDSTNWMNNESIHWERHKNKWREQINMARDIPDFDKDIAEK